MTVMIESEVKWRIAPEHVPLLQVRLRHRFGPSRGLVQGNQFFDSEDRRLRRNGMACRLRFESARAWLTCKARLRSVQGATRHSEHEWPLSVAEAAVLRSDMRALAMRLPAQWITALEHAPLIRIGGFTNYRREWHASGVSICLDRTLLPKRTDYELELEGGDPRQVSRRFRDYLRDWGIPWRPQRLTKFARALG